MNGNLFRHWTNGKIVGRRVHPDFDIDHTPGEETPEQIDRMLGSNLQTHHENAAHSPNLEPRHIDHILSNSLKYSSLLCSAAVANPNASKENLTKALSGIHSSSTEKEAILHPKSDSSHVGQALYLGTDGIRLLAARHTSATPHQLDRAIDDHSEAVALAATQNPNASQDNLKKAANHMSDVVRSIAKKRLGITEELDILIQKAVNILKG